MTRIGILRLAQRNPRQKDLRFLLPFTELVQSSCGELFLLLDPVSPLLPFAS